ncbi:MAG: ABC transporter ATP-binding protein [Desulfobacter sp.]|nr:ABC transporter ATP-binding protein [Desulfobacter sp.]WDP87875.1 MAG: ABC transporter ATP-binding protein [Desulfobacter sp.]
MQGPEYSGPLLGIRRLSKSFMVNGSRVEVLKDLSFEAREKEFVCILGQSGCGKSTLLKVMAGFIPLDSGQVLFQGSPITKPGPERCVVFQEDALFPWLTIEENIGFGLVKKTRGQRQKQVDKFLGLVGLSPFRKYLPKEISGGMKQRVALARVLVLNPRILLMDEPFAALDAQTRENMQDLLLALWQTLGHTIVFVTHDVREAVALSDRTMVMNQGPGDFARIVDINLDRPRFQEDERFMGYVGRLKRLVSSADTGRP